ncbi:hypothetical protein AB0D27_06375 [Streptomyces sp. NPDC048415]|uniref:hypothetical protein n=1 Tax=Streptomyces sp. NPDC048415 TaxID=3154822 RepID=UPI00344390A6
MTFDYYLNSSLQTETERTLGGAMVAGHALQYDPNGNQTQDVSTTQNADDHGAHLSRTSTSTYTPCDQTASVRNSDGTGAQNYAYDDNSDITSQTVGGTTTNNTYARNRLLYSTTPSGTIKYNYARSGGWTR